MKYFINILLLLILPCGGLCIEKKKDMILTGSVGIQQKFDSFMQCIRLCAQILACKSINYIGSETVCHINNREAGDAGTNLLTLSGSIYVNSRDFPKNLAGDCDNHTCLGNEMCASFATGNVGHTCFPLSAIGYSLEPNNCVRISCDSWGWRYTECDVLGLTHGRVVSMTLHSVRYHCTKFGSFYNWKRTTVYVDLGCRATFNVCYAVL